MMNLRVKDIQQKKPNLKNNISEKVYKTSFYVLKIGISINSNFFDSIKRYLASRKTLEKTCLIHLTFPNFLNLYHPLFSSKI